MELSEFFRENPKAALAFSGGVDSAYLLYAALHFGADVRAYYVKSAFQPQFELADARRLAEQLSAELWILKADVLACRGLRIILPTDVITVRKCCLKPLPRRQQRTAISCC